MTAIALVNDGDDILASQQNAIADELNGPRSAFTPAVAFGGVTASLGSGSTAEGRYKEHGSSLVVGHGHIAFGTGPTIGTGALTVSLPVPIEATFNGIIGVCITVDDSDTSRRRVGALIRSASSSAVLWINDSTQAASDSQPHVWTASDSIYYSFSYEPA